MSLAFKAMLFAKEVHKSQVRKYTGNPYEDHLAEVAGIVATVIDYEVYDDDHANIVIATAWLHDCVEDHGVTKDQLRNIWKDKYYWGIDKVIEGVFLLSDLEVGNRKQRVDAACSRLSKAPDWVQNIKCADIISNTKSIVKHDPSFAQVYLREKRLMLEMMSKANPNLMKLAYLDTF